MELDILQVIFSYLLRNLNPIIRKKIKYGHSQILFLNLIIKISLLNLPFFLTFFLKKKSNDLPYYENKESWLHFNNMKCIV